MKEIIQTSCSELLVDTAIHDPAKAYEAITGLIKTCEWEASPPITVELLADMKKHNEAQRFDEKDPEVPEVVIYDKYGNRAFLEYGNNGYIETLGYRFDSQCNHADDRCFPIFQKAIEKLNGTLIACDGGSTSDFYNWLGEAAYECPKCYLEFHNPKELVCPNCNCKLRRVE
jgi:hypothetical protein